MAERRFWVGKNYRDAQNKKPEDQFMAWLNEPGSGIKNSGGIRNLRWKGANWTHDALPSAIVLVTSLVKNNPHNPWHDVVDHGRGSIRYWGDAKFDEARGISDFEGNKVLEALHRAVFHGRLGEVPPILHFTRHQKGWVRFNGLCVLHDLRRAWHEDPKHPGIPVSNYLASLRILDEASVHADWLFTRRRGVDPKSALAGGPEQFKRYARGLSPRILRTGVPKILSASEQLPLEGTPGSEVLQQLGEVDPRHFELVVVEMLRVAHPDIVEIAATPKQRDRGFDFFGRFSLPAPLGYEIPFKGECKRHANRIDPGKVSRLVARLRRPEYGIFVTTSAYTKQAQEEVYELEYPVHLVGGLQLSNMFLHTGLAKPDGQLNGDWMRQVTGSA